MYKTLDIFKLSHAMAAHANARQRVVAENIANADTPDFRAKDIKPFSAHLAGTDDGYSRATRDKHFALHRTATPTFTTMQDARDLSPNGNSVSLETEMMKASEARHQQEVALAVYRSAMNIMRTSIGKG
ncbi:MAG: FlgB family protein [Halocynthiibacter sp.]